MSVSPKINHLTHTLLYCISSWGHPLPTCAKKSVSTTMARWLCQWHSSGNSPTKVNGKYSVWPIIWKQAPNTQPCYIASVCGGLTLLFLEKNPDLFPRPKFGSCKVLTHATEISQLKLMGNVAYVCISKKTHLTHTLLYCIRSWGHPLPTCAKKSVSSASAGLVVGDNR